MLKILHETHLGIEKTKARAREVLYWLGMCKDIYEYISGCEMCEKFNRNPQKEPLMSYECPTRPWFRISADIAYYAGNEYLVVIDSYSKWIELKKLKYKDSHELIKHFKEIFSRQGIPEVLIADNMPFNSFNFRNFANQWNFKVITTSPNYPQSNGLAEKGVGIVKNLFRKNTDIDLALLEYRTTPIVTLGFSPSQLLNNRRLRSKLPVNNKLLNTENINPKYVHDKLKSSQINQKKFYNRSAKTLSSFEPGQNVYVKNHNNWEKGKVEDKYDTPRSYIVKTEQGQVFRRNRRHLRESKKEFVPRGNVVDPISDSENETCTPSMNNSTPFKTVSSPTKINNDVNVCSGKEPVSRPHRNRNMPSKYKDYEVYGVPSTLK